MTYSIESRDRIYVKGYGLLSFAKNISKNLSNKYGQKLLDSAKTSTADAIKTTSKRANKKKQQKQLVIYLIGNKIAAKITSVSKKKPAKEWPNDETKEEDVEIATPKKRYMSPEEMKQIIEELSLVPTKYVWIKVNNKKDNKLFIN